jgi:hypothetical protein
MDRTEESNPSCKALRIQTLIERAREGDIMLDIPSPLPHTRGIVTNAALIAELEAKVKHYRERVEEYRAKLRVWETALASAKEEMSDNSTTAKKAALPAIKGKVSRDFVREILKSYAKKGGVTPKQIREIADQRGLAYPANFPHTTLHKFRTQMREAEEKGGKYFPITKGENNASSTTNDERK